MRLKGWGSPNSNEGTYTVVLYIYMYFVANTVLKVNTVLRKVTTVLKKENIVLMKVNTVLAKENTELTKVNTVQTKESTGSSLS